MIAFHGEPEALVAMPRAAHVARVARGPVRYVVRLADEAAAPLEPGSTDAPADVVAGIDVVRPGSAARHARYIVAWDDSHCCFAVHAFVWKDGDAKVSLAVGEPAGDVPVGAEVPLRFALPDGSFARVRARRLADGRLALRFERIVAAKAAR